MTGGGLIAVHVFGSVGRGDQDNLSDLVARVIETDSNP